MASIERVPRVSLSTPNLAVADALDDLRQQEPSNRES